MKRVSKKTGFTLVELLVVIGIIALLISILLPSLNKARETANRVKCQSNLSQMGKALLLYSNENKGAFPRTQYVSGTALNGATTGAGDDDPFINAATVPVNSIPAAMFLLIRTQDMTSEVFTCPSGTAERDNLNNEAATLRSNFSGGSAGTKISANVSYSFVNVYPSAAAITTGYKTFITAFSSDFPTAADIGPLAAPDGTVLVGAARSAMIKGNSKNHDQDGQNILYADGHAEFRDTSIAGVANDQIYWQAAATNTTDGASATASDPITSTDSCLFLNIVNH